MAFTTQYDLTLVPADSFARTYDGRAYDDPWQAVLDYSEVMEWVDNHPDHGAAAISRMLDLPRGRVQAWLGGSQPHSAKGLDIAHQRGWIDADPDGDTFRGLNALVAWIIQAGSIAEDTWVPLFVVGDETDLELLRTATELAGIEVDVVRSSAYRSQNYRPVQHGSIFGRVLVVLGAPQGEDRQEGDVTLPGYLKNVPERLAQEFVQCYLHHLGRSKDDRWYIHLPTNRSGEYVESVAELVRETTGERVSVIEQHVVLSKPATRAVAVWEPLLGVE